MAGRSKHSVERAAEERYLDLVRAFPLRPIHSEIELDRAIAVIDALIDRSNLDAGEEDYLDVLSDLVHRYEAEHDPIAPVTDSEMIRFLLDSNDITQATLAQQSEISESTISEILAGKRKLSRRHIAEFSRVFGVSPAIFFTESNEVTPERAAKILGRRARMKISHKMLISIASAFALDGDRACWRAFEEMIAGERPGTPPALMAKRLNKLGKDGGSDCWRPVPFQVTSDNLRALADAFSSEKECWKVFREMFEEALPEMRALQREFAEEN